MIRLILWLCLCLPGIAWAQLNSGTPGYTPPTIAAGGSATLPIKENAALNVLAKMVGAASKDNIQINQPMTVPAWKQSTTYFGGERIFSTDGGHYFEVVSGGSCVSAASGGGPVGVSANVADNTCIWMLVSGIAPIGGAPLILNAVQYANSTAYPNGTYVVTYTGSGATAVGNIYISGGGTSAGGGGGPTGAGCPTDGTISFCFVRAVPTAIFSNASVKSYLWNAGAGAGVGNVTGFLTLNGGKPTNSPGTGYMSLVSATVAGTLAAGSENRYEFITTAQTFVIRSFENVGSVWRIGVCDVNGSNCHFVSSNHYAAPLNNVWMRTVVDFTQAGQGASGRQPRHIILENGTSATLGGIDISLDDDLYPPGGSATLHMGTIGDSYPTGGGVQAEMWSFPRIVDDMLGIRDNWNSAIGGCGYTASLCSSGSMLSRLSDLMLTNAGKGPDVVLVGNGTNDVGVITAGAIGAAQTAYIQAFRAQPGMGSVPVFVLGIYSHNTSPCAACTAAETAEQTAVTAMADPNLFFCPWSNDPSPWETGTGTVQVPNSTGNSDVQFDFPFGHPNGWGNRAIAGRIARCIRSVLNAGGY